MREILFRGIPKNDCERHLFTDIWKDNSEGSFVYGSLIISKDRYYICVSALCAINSCINNGMTSMIEVIPESISEFTGLTDKNGKKIFEGDICRNFKTGEIVSVKWHGTMAGYVWSKKRENVKHLYEFGELFRAYDKYEVIGNIHDNPELLCV